MNKTIEEKYQNLIVSSEHFKIRINPIANLDSSKRKFNFVLFDLHSSNGTFVNGSRVNEKELENRDIIQIGSTNIECFIL